MSGSDAMRSNRSREAIRAENVVKVFGKVTALAGVSMQVARGETLGILGDNGAGKSTLIKILTGYHQPDCGQVFVDGRPVELASVDDARALGIECVYQDLALVNGLSIYHNMFLNRELLRGVAVAVARPSRDAAPRGRGIGGYRRRRALGRARGRHAVGRPAPGDRGRPRGLFEGAHPAARRAAGGDGRARGAADHRPDRAAARRAATSPS